MMRAPSRPVVRNAHLTLKKKGELFTDDRQLGLAWDQFYDHYHSEGRLQHGDVTKLTLDGGGLSLWRGGRWQRVRGAEVPLKDPARPLTQRGQSASRLNLYELSRRPSPLVQRARRSRCLQQSCLCFGAALPRKRTRSSPGSECLQTTIS